MIRWPKSSRQRRRRFSMDVGQDRRHAAEWMHSLGASRFVHGSMRSRDRVTIDLCGIGDAARAAARARGMTLALFARQALIAALPDDAAAMLPCAEPSADLGGTIKLSVRLSAADSAALATQAAALGLSQARLRRAADPSRASCRCRSPSAVPNSRRCEPRTTSSPPLRRLSLSCARCRARPSAALAPLRQRMLDLDVDIAQHLRVAAALLSRIG